MMSSAEPITIVGIPLASTARATMLAVWWHKGHMGTTSATSIFCSLNILATFGPTFSMVPFVL